jgi:competence protein ComEC
MLLTPAFTRLMTGLRDRDAMLAPQPSGALAATGRWVDGKVFAAIVTGIVAWLVSMPLVAWHFGQINPWAIVASILLAIPVFLSLIGGLLKVLLTFAWPSAAGAWATVVAAPVQWMRGLLGWLSLFPGSSVPIPAPPWYLLGLCYLLLLASVFVRARAGLRWTLIFLAVVAYAAILALPVREAVVRRVATRDDLRVTLLSVGAGQCAVVEPPGGRTTLIDAGSTSLTDLWRKCLGPFLHAAGRTSLDTVVVSHGDMDHISGVAETVSIYGVREVLAGAHLLANAPGNPAVEGLLATLDALDRPPRVVLPGDVLPLGRDTKIEILWPRPGGQPLPDNDAGVVLKLTHAGRSILFPADVQDLGMEALLKDPAALKADVLVAPHHGSSERLTAAFVAAVNPAAVLSSNDRTLSNKQRRFESMIGERPLYRTNACGAITVVFQGDGTIHIEPFQTGTMKPMTIPPPP